MNFRIKTFLSSFLIPNVKVPSLLFHSVAKESENPFPGVPFHNVVPDCFYSQLKRMKKKATPIFLEELFERKNKGKQIKDVFTVSFDDGYNSVIQEALPILNSLDVPATLFINSGFQSNPFWRDQVRILILEGRVNEFLKYAGIGCENETAADNYNFYRLSKKGHFCNSLQMRSLLSSYFLDKLPEANRKLCDKYVKTADLRFYKNLKIGNHTYDHLILSDLEMNAQLEQIERQKAIIDRLNINKSEIFSFPFGGESSFNNDTIMILEELKYAGAVMSGGYYSIESFDGIPAVSGRKHFPLAKRFMPLNRKSVQTVRR